MLVCALFAQSCTRDRGCSAHPAFPAPFFEGEEDRQNPGNWAAGMRRCVLWSEVCFAVIARSASDEAIHFSACGEMDCFASLAMTEVTQTASFQGDAPRSWSSSPGLPPSLKLRRASMGKPRRSLGVAGTGRSSIPETPAIEPMGRDVLDTRMRGYDELGAARDSPMCNCAPEVWSFGPSRNDGCTGARFRVRRAAAPRND